MNQTPAEHSRRFFWLTCFVLLAALVLGNASLPPRIQGADPNDPDYLADSVSEGYLSRRVAFIGLACFGIFGLSRQDRRPIGLNGWLGIALGGLVFLGFASVLWSSDSTFSLRRLFVLGSSCLAALAIGRSFSARQMLQVAVVTSALHLAIDFGLALAMGWFRPWEAGYRFAGTLHPNHEGLLTAVLFLSASILARTATRRRAALWALAAVAMVFLYLTHSRTSLIACVLGYAAARLLTSSRTVQLASLCLAGTLLGAVAFLPTGVIQAATDPLLQREDSDMSSLTGRIPLWQEVLPYVHARPILGYGWNSFWTSKRIADVADSQGWAIGHAHCDYIEILLNLGIVGFTLYVASLVLGIRLTCQAHRAYPERGYDGLCAWLCFAVIGGLTEAVALQSMWFQLVSWCALAHVGFQSPDEFLSENEGQP